MPPKQKPHRSEQVVETPDALLEAVRRRFGSIDFDLAATKENAKAPRFYTPKDDSLKQSWALGPSVRVAWLNPQFGNLKPWAEKCSGVRHLKRWTLMLAPMGTQEWACLHMWERSYVLKLRGRVTFKNHETPFPKDMVLACYGFGLVGEEVWDWDPECPF